MTRYYFDLHECGDIIPDQDGSEAQHIDAARSIAVTAARDIMCGEISGGALCLACFIEIRDEHHVLERVMFRDAIQISGL